MGSLGVLRRGGTSVALEGALEETTGSRKVDEP